MIDLKSFWMGIQAMGDRQFHFFNPKYWRIRFQKMFSWHPSGHCIPDFWIHLWTPIWHEKRGPYISIGLGFFAIYRGF